MIKFSIALICLVIGNLSIASAEQQTITLGIEKMTCALCPFTVRAAIGRIEGVALVEVDFSKKTAEVTFDDTITNTASVAAASTHAGYPATPKTGG